MKVKYFYSGNIYQNKAEVEIIDSPIEGELWVPNFKTKESESENAAKKALPKELLSFLQRNKKDYGNYNLDVVLMKKYEDGLLFGERTITSFSYEKNYISISA